MNARLSQRADAGARLAIRLLQDAAQQGDLDPWDVDVIAVIDGFLDQLKQRIEVPRQVEEALKRRGGSYERDLADSSEAFLAASVLVGLKAEVLEASTFPPQPEVEEMFEADFADQGWLDPSFDIPRHPERHLQRRPVAPPPLRRPVTLGELIEQLESIAEQLESDELDMRRRQRQKRYSNKEAIAQVAALAHREKLPETTAAMGVFLNGWEAALQWVNFEQLVVQWNDIADEDLDKDPPASVIEFRNALSGCDGVILCSPEYVFSLPGSFKNALDWLVSTTVLFQKPLGENKLSLQALCDLF